MPTDPLAIESTLISDPGTAASVEALRNHPAAGRPASLAAAVEAVLIPDTVAAALCGISRAHLHRLRAAGKWGPETVPLGRKRLYKREEVIAWARAGCPDGATWRAMQAAASRRSARAMN